MTTKKQSKPLTFWALVDVDGFPWVTMMQRYALRGHKFEYERDLRCHGPYRIIKVAEVVREVKRGKK
jgi:hypothetical protein